MKIKARAGIITFFYYMILISHLTIMLSCNISQKILYSYIYCIHISAHRQCTKKNKKRQNGLSAPTVISLILFCSFWHALIAHPTIINSKILSWFCARNSTLLTVWRGMKWNDSEEVYIFFYKFTNERSTLFGFSNKVKSLTKLTQCRKT